MRNNWVRERLKRGQATIGCQVGLGSPNVIELLAQAGYDWLIIESEHNGLDSAEIQNMLMAMNGTEAIPIVRIPSSNYVYIQRALDMGAMGIMAPLVKTAEEARAIVSATRYPPSGIRSLGPLRASKYTLDNEDYFNRANDNTLVTFILETKEAVENLEEICRVPGVDVLFFGSWDLCLSYGLNPFKQPYPEIEAVQERMLEVGKKTGVAMGIGAVTPDQLRKRQSQGFTFLNYGPEYKLFVDAISAGLNAFVRN
jgi:2-dehydro-3-deoxyglucarate aldolase